MNSNERHQPSDSELESETDEKLESALVELMRPRSKPDWDGIVRDAESPGLVGNANTSTNWITTRETTVARFDEHSATLATPTRCDAVCQLPDNAKGDVHIILEVSDT